MIKYFKRLTKGIKFFIKKKEANKMANFPTIVDTVEQLRGYKIYNSYTNAQVTELLQVFGWTWNEGHVELLLAGKKKPTADEVIFIQKFLLSKYYEINIGA